ncbi:hypothetical protein IM25_23775 (plasmid) [Rhodococcus sp. p52]|uniref:pentapeptide repeat-containing protein n=1 Tax=Rhodococcus sp. p52 TaxID=935199 RepID=UPI0008243C78|nr:pentapeptide repeat-containing protein [Rhodococcus sp. p52]AOD24760.1 hypothetical protein IM25_23775 [Rhodococcus sp. p52]
MAQWRSERRPDEYLDLANIRLRSLALIGVDLSRTHLSRADLTGTDLTGADLTDAYLTRAKLPAADLTEADLSRTVLTDANLTRADVSLRALSSASIERLEFRAQQERVLPDNAVAGVSIEVALGAGEDPATILDLMRAVETLCRLAVEVGVRTTPTTRETGQIAVAVGTPYGIEIKTTRIRYGSPLWFELIELSIQSGALFAGVRGVAREVDRGEDSRLLNLILMLCRKSERRALLDKRDARNKLALAKIETEIRAVEGESNVSDPVNVQIAPSSGAELRGRVDSSEIEDPIARAEIEARLGNVIPMFERGFTLGVTDPPPPEDLDV